MRGLRASLADVATAGEGRPETAQATVRSATKTFPLVSGLNSTATRKMAKPTTVVTRIGPERATFCVVAYKMSSGEINPPQIAPWWKQNATAVARTSVGNRSER